MWNFVATVTVLMLLNMDIVCPFLSVGKLVQLANLNGFVVEGIVVEGIVVEGTGRGNVAFVGDMMGLG